MEMANQDPAQDLYAFEIARFRELLRENPDYAWQRYGFTIFYSLPAEETFELRRQLGWKTGDSIDSYNLGAVECRNGNYDEAMKHFEKALTDGCSLPELFYNIAAVHEEKKNMKKAVEFYQKYIDAVEKWDDIPKTLQAELDEARDHLAELRSSSK